MDDDVATADPAEPWALPHSVSRLIPAVARVHRALAAELLRPLRLHPGQELLLMLLWERDLRPQHELARELAVEPPTVAKTVTRLEASGFVERQRSGDDARVVLVALTDAGRALRDPVRAVWRELERRSTADLSDTQRARLIAGLRRVLANVEREAPPQP